MQTPHYLIDGGKQRSVHLYEQHEQLCTVKNAVCFFIYWAVSKIDEFSYLQSSQSIKSV